MRFRIIPLTIVFCGVFLSMKIVALIQGGQEFSDSLIISRVEAETAPATEEKKPEEAKPDAAGEAKNEGEVKEGEAKEGEAKEEEEKKPEGNPNVSATPGDITERRFTTVELELLQKLSKRREDLEKWEANLQIKESAMEATEKRVNDKIAQIEAIKTEVSELLNQYNTIEDKKIASLVKIYENMKPADAARIFDDLEMPVLLVVADKMSEKKAAPIFGAMNPKKAKQLTVELAAQRQIATTKIGAAKDAVKP